MPVNVKCIPATTRSAICGAARGGGLWQVTPHSSSQSARLCATHTLLCLCTGAGNAGWTFQREPIAIPARMLVRDLR